MKELSREQDGDQNVGATAFDYPNAMNPYGKHPVFYGNQNVPKPTNMAARVTNGSEVMRAVNQGK